MLPIIDNIATPAFIPMPGPTELLIILGIVLLIFGPKKLPEMGKAIGQSIRELRKASDNSANANTEEPTANKEDKSK